MASVREVAARARVSVGTVSRVINGYTDVSPVLRARVEEAMRELSYAPNQLARNFRRQRTGTIGVVVPDITAPFFADLVKQIEAAAREAGYSVLIGNSDNRSDVESEYVSRLDERGVDGLILAPSMGGDHLAALDRARLVVVDQEVEGLDVVATDHETGARDVVQHLVSLGHTRIACIAGPQTAFRQRLVGYRAIVQPLLSAGSNVSIEAYIRVEPMGDQWGLHSANELLNLPQPPTAIFATSDQQAIGVLRACADRNLRVPQDISVVGFDDIPLADLVQPRLTTVQQPTREIGRLVVERLLRRFETPGLPALRRVVPGRLMVRRSSGPPPRGTARRRRVPRRPR
jgi:LacI family transcriptional regulator